MLPEIIY